jgi:acetamidase/formamidase
MIHINSGDMVEVETPLDGAKALQSFGAPAEVITAVSLELEDVPQKDRGLGPNILVGPIAVNGAEPGDVLEVKIMELHPADNYAENLFVPDGTLSEDLPQARARLFRWTVRNVAVFAPSIEFPCALLRTMGVAPRPWLGRINDGPPDYIGGNLDNKELVAGSVLYIPSR